MEIKIIGAEGFDHIKSKCKAENRKITEIISRCIEQGIYIDNEIMSKVIEEYKKRVFRLYLCWHSIKEDT